MGAAVDLLAREMSETFHDMRSRLHGLTEDEFFWEPVPDCWNIRPDEQHVGGWSYEYEFAPADPAPLTTIGWRLVHLNAGNRLYWNHSFGDATLTFPDLVVPHTAETALAEQQARAPVDPRHGNRRRAGSRPGRGRTRRPTPARVTGPPAATPPRPRTARTAR